MVPYPVPAGPGAPLVTPPARTRPGALAAVFWLTILTSASRTSIFVLAFPWLALKETGSPALIGLLGALTLLAGAILAPLLGPVIDYAGRRLSCLAADAMVLAGAVLSALAAQAGVLTLGLMLVLAPVIAVARGAGSSSRKALVPDLAEHTGLRHTVITIGRECALAGGFVATPLVSGFLLRDDADGALVFWLAALLTALGLLGMLTLPAGLGRPRPRASAAGAVPPKTTAPEAPPVGRWPHTARLVLRSHPELVRAVLMGSVVAGVLAVFQQVAAPIIAEEAGGAEHLGFITAGYALGTMTGSLAHLPLARRVGRRVTVICSLAVGVAGLLATPLMLSPALVFPLGVVIGAGLGLSNPLWAAVLAERSPYRARARIVSAQALMSAAAGGVCVLLAGVMAELTGLVPVVMGVAGLWALSAVLWLRLAGEETVIPPAPAHPAPLDRPAP
ncbi:MFS transporter [Sediminivirga luteola]|uniref:Multidrug efflux pump Tap n=1 Tax=Sediminivirga luteola TaxID=1774748 RepID=A0A8J2U0R8_9MICO|nr:MFS transporter [Sediminivirga luteola]GGA25705.1 putative multidrug-efflux transporter [Sediminivirga luteola]